MAPRRIRFQPGRRAGFSGGVEGGPSGGRPPGAAGVPPRGGDGEPGRTPLRGEVVTLTGPPMIGALPDAGGVARAWWAYAAAPSNETATSAT